MAVSSIREGILPRVSRGEPRAMNDCIQAYGGLVWSITRRYVGNESDAEDLVQEIFTELWKVADRYDGARGSESAYIGTMARRRSIDWLRKSKRHPEAQPLPEVEDFLPLVEARPTVAYDGPMLLEVLNTFPEDTRELFQLHFESGLTHPEIAEKTGVPLGT
ncbi:MAG: sigma-70 family RNA polymerase sigma factor, partial [Verrucomicrobiota bacterium]